MIKKFLSWLNKRLRRIPSFQALWQALFASVARSCRIRRNPQAIRTLKAISPFSPSPSLPSSPPSFKRSASSSRWFFSKSLSPKGKSPQNKRKRTTHKSSPEQRVNDQHSNPRQHSQRSPLSDPNNIVYVVPRAEIIDTLNHTLAKSPSHQAPSRSSAHNNAASNSHPEMGPFSPKRESGPGSTAAPGLGSPLLPQRNSKESHSLNRGSLDGANRGSFDRAGVPINRPVDRPVDQLERSYGDHPDTLDELSDSAYLCECQGRYAEAERLYKQVLTLKQRRLGPDHLETATTLNDLAALYCLRNRHEVALPLLQKTLTIRQQHLVAYHPDLGETLHQLAKIYRHQAQYGKAEPLFQQALSIFRQQLGAQHPCTQAVYNDLMQMIVATIEDDKFSDLVSELPPLDLNTLSDTYSWAKPSWQQ